MSTTRPGLSEERFMVVVEDLQAACTIIGYAVITEDSLSEFGCLSRDCASEALERELL